MLKIKDNVKLKELERFGFAKIGYKYWRDVDKNWVIVINDKRDICCWNYVYSGYKRPDKHIQDLIQAGLVEKVEQ